MTKFLLGYALSYSLYAGTTTGKLVGEYCFVTKSHEVRNDYCLKIGKSSISVYDGPNRYVVKKLLIDCNGLQCSVLFKDGGLIGRLLLHNNSEFEVLESRSLSEPMIKNEYHGIDKIFQIGDRFKRIAGER